MFVYQEECCGIDGYHDWKRYDTYWKKHAKNGTLAPETCCQIQYSDDDLCNTRVSDINQKVRPYVTCMQ